ncbi:tail fiber domain-containing protein [Vibrio tetraodonis]|uniref:tail fiber domain-containing protein n=1 Tax=Vibrio tetraodonis TaxID=2231647 RepID=UPI000E0AD3C3|nr:tail fiber domain-containing protein [Vibrio tetraodonis]
MLKNNTLYFITFFMAFVSNLVNADNLPQPKVCPDKFQPWCSDIKLKKNITNIISPIEKVNRIQGVRYQLNGSDRTEFGFIAQDLKLVYPEVVHDDPEAGYLRVDYRSMIPILLEAIKAQNKRIQTLESQMNK